MENEKCTNVKRNTLEILTDDLTKLENNTNDFVKSLEQLRSDNRMNELAKEIQKLRENIHIILDPFWQQLKDEMFDAKCYVKEKEEEVRKLETEIKNKEEAFKIMKQELDRTKMILFYQSFYTATLGATLCSILWQASRKTSMVLDLLKGKKILDFLQIAASSLRSFFKAFCKELPKDRSQEGTFISSIVGVIANIAAVPEGRKFLLLCKEGEDSIREMVKIVSRASPTATYIQRVILMALYNLSLDKRGNLMIENDLHFLPALVNYITQQSDELRFISLKLLQSLAFDISDLNTLAAFTNAIQSTQLEEMENHCTSENERNMITQIIENIDSAKLRLQIDDNGDCKTYDGF